MMSTVVPNYISIRSERPRQWQLAIVRLCVATYLLAMRNRAQLVLRDTYHIILCKS